MTELYNIKNSLKNSLQRLVENLKKKIHSDPFLAFSFAALCLGLPHRKFCNNLTIIC